MRNLTNKLNRLYIEIKKKFFKQEKRTVSTIMNENSNTYDEYVGYYYSGTRWSLSR